ncbi:MAG: hypothetical protein SWJ54_08505 [Cyanobacteriota bacterium]|nr:hypothetical protein [Cyanobacteriota bacterium]
MSSPIIKFIEFQLQVPNDHPALLEGLEVWLNLGLLSDQRVRQLCQQYLSEPLPPQPQTITEISPSPISEDSSPKESIRVPQPESHQSSTPLASRLFQSFKAEFSVRWLLFLGLFMVLVSSGVLVASRWQELPILGQYCVLFTYTLGFCIATVLLRQNSRLPLTAEALQWVTLLLIPLNFWAIDGLGVLYSNLIISIIFSVVLTGITIFINSSLFSRHSQNIQLQRLLIFNQLGLSYLHLGWRFTNIPLIAIYLGIIGTGLITFYRRQQAEQTNLTNRKQLPLVFCLVPVVFLWWRIVSVVNLDLSQLGLALALTGGLLHLYSSVWLQRCTYLLLALGWLVSIENRPEQALAVNGLAFILFGLNLKQFWRRRDFTLIFVTGLQSLWLVWRLIPIQNQQQILEFSQQITQSPNQAWTVLSLVGLIYAAFILILIDWIEQTQHSKLARFGEQLTLEFSAILAVASLFDPVVRSLYFLSATFILIIYTVRRQPLRAFLVYLTHVIGLVALFSWIDLLFPSLRLEQWGILSVITMLGEWLFYSIGTNQSTISITDSILKSCWYIGLGLASLSYYFFYSHAVYNTNLPCTTLTCQDLSQWGITWLITPIALTAIASYIPPRRELASLLSITAAVMVQLLVFRIPGIRLISLSVSTGLMILNTNLLQNQISAGLTIGFGLIFYGFLVWEIVPNLSLAGGLIFIAIALNLLWISQIRLNQLSSSLASLYTNAIDDWATILYWIEVTSLTIYAVLVYWQLLSPNILALLATVLSIIAMTIRIWNDSTSEDAENTTQFLRIYILGWLIELLIAHALSFTENSLFNLSIANLALGLGMQLFGDYWRRKKNLHHLSNPWQILPLFYGIFGTVLRSSGNFDNWTGSSLFILAFILIGIGRRSSALKSLTYFGIFSISLAAYQLLFYNLSSIAIAEQLVACAGLGTTLVYVYRVLSPQLIRYLHLNQTEIKTIAHLHWAMSSCFLMISLLFPSESNPLISLGIALFLTRYAIFQGRYNPNSVAAELWVYVGCLEAIAVGYYISDLLNLQEFLISWGGAIASLICYFIYFLPWESWGWILKPWQRIAISIPILAVILTAISSQFNLDYWWYFSTFIAIILYLVLARFSQKIRLTYFSIGLANFAFYSWLFSTEYNLNALGDAILPGLSCLYFAQVDPDLQHSEQRQLRHWIRIFGIGMICITALLTSQWSGVLPGLISLIAIFIGLGLRIRAFLYVGTATFLINAVNQLLILNSIYSFFKWIVGFIIGLILIWIAANFETRREQIITALQNWIVELNEWE